MAVTPKGFGVRRIGFSLICSSMTWTTSPGVRAIMLLSSTGVWLDIYPIARLYGWLMPFFWFRR